MKQKINVCPIGLPEKKYNSLFRIDNPKDREEILTAIIKDTQNIVTKASELLKQTRMLYYMLHLVVVVCTDSAVLLLIARTPNATIFSVVAIAVIAGILFFFKDFLGFYKRTDFAIDQLSITLTHLHLLRDDAGQMDREVFESYIPIFFTNEDDMNIFQEEEDR